MLAQLHYIPDSVRAWLDDPRWWLSNWARSDRRLKVGVHPLSEVIEVLSFVYDEAACRRMVEDGYWAPLFGLFYGAPFEWAGVLLAVGADFLDGAAAADASLLDRLRTGQQWHGARLELGVLAGLRRHGFAPSRPVIPRDRKQWDFTVDVDGEPCAIECKTLSAGNVDGNLDLITQRFENFAAEFGLGPHCDAVFAISDALGQLMRDLPMQEFYMRVLPELTEELRRALAAADIDGRQCLVGRFGGVTRTLPAETTGLLSWTVTGGSATLFQRLRRLANTFADATGNFEESAADAHRTTVVWLGTDYLDCTSAIRFITDNWGRTVREGDVSVSLGAERFRYDTGIALGATRPFHARSWQHSREILHVGSRSRHAFRVYDAVSAWRYHTEAR